MRAPLTTIFSSPWPGACLRAALMMGGWYHKIGRLTITLHQVVSSPDLQNDLYMNALRKHIENRLTPRQFEVFKLVAKGFTNSEIATSLDIGKRTVQTHHDEVNKRLGANIALLTQLAYVAGFIGPTDAVVQGNLTPRQRQVALLIADGKLSKEIASELDLGVRTVETHRERIMRKWDVHNASQLTLKALSLGIAMNKYPLAKVLTTAKAC